MTQMKTEKNVIEQTENEQNETHKEKMTHELARK